jgi:hypothetical protein
MQVILAIQQHKRGYQSHQTKKMIAMQMRNKNMIDFGKLYFVFSQLHLRSFPTIN